MVHQLKEKVIDCLTKYPHTRNCDMWLTFAIIWRYLPEEIKTIDNKTFISTDALKLIREDNVKRIRAKLNSEGKFLPDNPLVRAQRKINEERWLKFLGYETNTN